MLRRLDIMIEHRPINHYFALNKTFAGKVLQTSEIQQSLKHLCRHTWTHRKMPNIFWIPYDVDFRSHDICFIG